MKLRTIVKIAITSSVVLLCSGFALYSFFRLSAAEGQKDFDLYELVPSTTSAVFVTDDVLEFVAEVDDLTCTNRITNGTRYFIADWEMGIRNW